MAYIIGGMVALLVLWYLIAMTWAAIISQQTPELHESARQIRYGWRCSRCGHVEAPICKIRNCRGPLVWVQRNTRIKCARCHRHLIAHPMLFRQTPRSRPVRCRQCGWIGIMKDWKLD